MDWQCVVHPEDYSGRHYWEVTHRTTRPKGATRLWQWWGRIRDMTENNNLLKQLLARQMSKPSTTLGKPEVLSWPRVRNTQAEVLAGFSTKVGDSSAGIISLPQCPFSAYIAGLLEHTVTINKRCPCCYSYRRHCHLIPAFASPPWKEASWGALSRISRLLSV